MITKYKCFFLQIHQLQNIPVAVDETPYYGVTCICISLSPCEHVNCA